MIFALLSFSLCDCFPGLLFERFNNEITWGELIGFHIMETGESNDFNYVFQGIVISGVFCPKRTGNYRARFEGKPFSMILFDGEEINKLGTPLWCIDATTTSGITEEHFLKANHCYGVTLKLRTGCGLWKNYLNFKISYEGEDFYFPNQTELKSCSTAKCADGYYGDDCQPNQTTPPVQPTVPILPTPSKSQEIVTPNIPTSEPTEDIDSNNKTNKLNANVKAGLIVGAVFLVVILMIIILFVIYKKTREKSNRFNSSGWEANTIPRSRSVSSTSFSTQDFQADKDPFKHSYYMPITPNRLKPSANLQTHFFTDID